MKLSKFWVAGPLLVLLALGGAGCKTHKTTTLLSNGYEVVSHPDHTLIDDPQPPRYSFQYRAKDGTFMDIWPSLYSPQPVIHGDLAVFIAEKAFKEPERTTHPRVFAVRPPDLPLDLTDEILWRWSRANHRTFPKTMEKFAAVTASENDDHLILNLEFWAATDYGSERDDWPDTSTMELDWQQVDEIIHAVKTKGVQEKDIRWHSAYIGEKY